MSDSQKEFDTPVTVEEARLVADQIRKSRNGDEYWAFVIDELCNMLEVTEDA